MSVTRRRISSVLGVLVMLIGTLLVIVPSAGAGSGDFPDNGTHKVPLSGVVVRL